MVSVAISGAAGTVGRIVTEAFDDQSLQLLTHSEHRDIDSQVLDVGHREAFGEALSGVDVLVHLAWGPAESERWGEDHGKNVQGTANALAAAVENDLDRVVVASTNHVTGMYNREDPSDAESLAADPGEAVHPDDKVRPDSFYGVAKVACEALGQYHADRDGLEVVSLRIGWVQSRADLREVQDDRPERARFARAMWLSPRDCRAIVRSAALEPIDSTPLVVNAISRNAERYLSITEATLHLDYRPQDDATAVVEGS